MSIETFISENFLIPLCRYYTPIGTLTYGIILVMAVVGIYKLLKILKIKIDKKFLIGILPFIIYGGWTRALRDYKLGIYQSSLFCSPPIYFFIFIIALFSLLIGVLIERKKGFGYEKTMFFVALPLLFYNLTLTSISNIQGFIIIISLVSFWSLLFFSINKIKPKILTRENAFILVSHLLDASATFTALTFFGFYEQHVLPIFLISMSGPWIMFPLKIIVVWPILYYIDKSKEDIFFKRFLKIIILILGLALGIRDFLSVSLLT
jgi:uncharacterized membrane protein